MYRPGADENAIEMSDVLCDFCGAAWTEDTPLIEGHRGACLCGRCLTHAWRAVHDAGDTAPRDYWCVMCREGRPDRVAQNRGEEPGWTSPAEQDRVEASVCRRCVRQAGVTLERDEDFTWRRPGQ